MLNRLLYVLGIIVTLPLIPFAFVGFMMEEDGWFTCLGVGLLMILMIVTLPLYLATGLIKWIITGSSWGLYD